MKNHYLKICAGLLTLITASILIGDSIKSSFTKDIDFVKHENVIEELKKINSPESFVHLENDVSELKNDDSPLEIDSAQDAFFKNTPKVSHIDSEIKI